jgi:glycosyltransferase involved in cell wall biosynthesis
MLMSVIIPTYNSEDFVADAVRSVWQTAPQDTEIVVIDDGSRDRTLEVVRQLATVSPFPLRLDMHPGHINCGPGASRNLGIRIARGEFVAFLDSDDIYLTGRFEHDLPRLLKEPGLDGVFGWVRIKVPANVTDKQDDSSKETMGLPVHVDEHDVLKNLLNAHFWAIDAVTLRRSTVLRVGGFGEHLRMAEDCYLWFKLATSARLCPSDNREPVAIYRRRENSTLQVGAESQAWLLQAMAEAAIWANHQTLPRKTRYRVQHGARAYFIRIVGAARLEGRTEDSVMFVRKLFNAVGGIFFLEPHVLWLTIRVFVNKYVQRKVVSTCSSEQG